MHASVSLRMCLWYSTALSLDPALPRPYNVCPFITSDTFFTYATAIIHQQTWRPLVSSTASDEHLAITVLNIPPIEQIRTTTTDLLKISHPVMLAGMNVAAGPKLAAAVSNAGGIGVIGGVGYTPDMLREQVAELKGYLKDKSAPFGVDLLIPQVGGSARKTK